MVTLLKKLLIIYFLLTTVNLLSQDLPEIIPPSPSSQVIERFGNYPVNHSTGIPDISIPIYEIRAGGLILPIVLRYHPANVKPTFSNDYYSPDVGLGWSLDTGGEISRTIYGIPDDRKNRLDKPSFYSSSDFGGIDQTENEEFADLADIYRGVKDAEYDIFNYSFVGNNGKFIIQNNALNFQEHLFLKKPYKFNFSEGLNQYGQNRLIEIGITDDLGNIYSYGGQNYFETSLIDGQSNSSGITTWKLRKIESLTKSDSINFYYLPKESSFSHSYQYSFQLNNDDLNVILAGDCAIYPNESPTYNDFKYPLTQTRFKHNELELKRIESKNGSIDFELNSSNNSILSISVFENNSLIKKVQFEYSNNKLVSLKIYGKDENNFKIYSFDYYQGEIGDPKSVDYWGYFNGSNGAAASERSYNYFHSTRLNGNTYLKESQNYTTTGSGSAEPNSNVFKGLLYRIIYPTSGQTEFIYEQNRYKSNLNGIDDFSESNISGGVRIKRIKSIPVQGSEVTKTYRYGDNDVLNFKLTDPEWNMFATTTFALSVATQICNVPTVLSTRNRTYSNFLPSFFNTAPRYKVVEEISGLNTSNSLGKSLYYFDYPLAERSVYNSYFSMISGHLGRVMPSVIRDLGNNNLIKVEHFKKGEEDDSFYKVKKELFEYETTFDVTDFKNLRVFKLTSLNHSEQSVNTIYDENYWLNYLKNNYGQYGMINNFNILGHRSYYIEKGSKNLKSKTEFFYYNQIQDSVIVREEFDYNANNQLVVSKRKLNGETSISYLNYPRDITSNTSLGLDGLTSGEKTAIDQLKTDHRISEVVQTETFLDSNNNGLGDPEERISTQRTNYKVESGIVQPIEVQSLKGVYDPVNNVLETRIVYENYDSRGNPLEVKKADGPSISYLWGYNGQYPIAKIENATIDEIETKIGDINNIDENDFTAINSLRSQLPNAMITTYEYEPLVGVTKITDPRGQEMTYEYDGFNRLKAVLDDDLKLLQEYKYHYKGQN